VVYHIDPGTGQATPTTTLAGGQWFSYSGASFLDGDLYASDVYHVGDYTVGTVDLDSGAYTCVGDQHGSWNWHGLASSDAEGIVWSIDLDDGGKLKSMTADGTYTVIGPTGIDGRGLAYDDQQGILYATGGYGSPGATTLYTVDTTTGAATLVGSMGLDSVLIGLAYDEVNEILYANAVDTAGDNLGRLYTVDVASGATTLVGLNHAGQIDGLAWIPEPTGLSILALGGLATIGRRQAAHGSGPPTSQGKPGRLDRATVLRAPPSGARQTRRRAMARPPSRKPRP